MDVPAPLQKRVGPFSLGAWLVIGIAGIGIGLLIRRSGLFNNPTPEPLESVDENGNPITTTPVGPGYAYPAGTVPTGNAPAGQSSSTSTTEPMLEDNLGWSKRAIAWLIAQGVDPADADAGIRKYLNGDALTANQLRAVKRALSETTIGPPPEYVPAINQTPEAPPEAPPSPPTPTPTPVAPTPTGPSSVTGAGALVQDGSGAVFFTNGNAIEWVPNGNVSIAKWRAGASVAGFAGALDPNAPSAFPVPHTWSRAQVQSIPYKVGPAPPEWGSSWT